MKRKGLAIRLLGILVLCLCFAPAVKSSAASYKPVDISKLAKDHQFYARQNGVQYKNTLYYQVNDKILAYSNSLAESGKKAKVKYKNVDGYGGFKLEKNYLVYNTSDYDKNLFELHLVNLKTKKNTVIAKDCEYIQSFDGKYITYRSVEDYQKSITVDVKGKQKADTSKFDASGYVYYQYRKFTVGKETYVGIDLRNGTSKLLRFDGKKYETLMTSSEIIFSEPYFMKDSVYFFGADLRAEDECDNWNYKQFTEKTPLYQLVDGKTKLVATNDLKGMNYCMDLSVQTFDDYFVVEMCSECQYDVWVLDSDLNFLYIGNFDNYPYYLRYTLKDDVFYTYFIDPAKGKKAAKQFTATELLPIKEGKKAIVKYTTEGKF